MKAIFFSVLFCFSSWAAVASANTPTLQFGDAAPPITVEKWMHGEPIPQFEHGKIYLVEFWATWCGPCIAAMPHLAELQKKYTKDGVHVLTVAASEQKGIEEAEKMRFEKFADYPFSWAYDSSGKMKSDWMTASGSLGIPNTFIVDRDGVVVSIGHPMGLDEVLPKVIAGTWRNGPMQSARQSREERQKMDAEIIGITKELHAAINNKDWPTALALSEKGLKLAPGHFGFISDRLKVLREHGSYDQLIAEAREFTTKDTKDPTPSTITLSQLFTLDSSYQNHLSATQRQARLELGRRLVARIFEPDDHIAKYPYHFYPTVAQYFYETGEPKLAVQLIRVSIDSLPDDPRYKAYFLPTLAAALAEYTNEKVCIGEVCVPAPANPLYASAPNVTSVDADVLVREIRERLEPKPSCSKDLAVR